MQFAAELHPLLKRLPQHRAAELQVLLDPVPRAGFAFQGLPAFN